MTPDEAIKRAERGELLPVWLLSGEERLMRDLALVAITKAALAGAAIADFNLDKFSAGDTPIDKILAATRTVPMMAKRRVVIIRGLERWDSASGDTGEEDTGKALPPLDRLAEYAKAPVDSTCMILVAQKIDGRRKLVALAKKSGFLVDCAPVDSRQIPGWIRAMNLYASFWNIRLLKKPRANSVFYKRSAARFLRVKSPIIIYPT